MVDVLPTTTTTTTFKYISNIGSCAMNAANKHAYSWGRAVGEDPSALLLEDLKNHIMSREMDVNPLTPKEIVAIEDFIRGLDWVLWSAVMVGRGFEWRKDWMSRVGDAVNE
jgi:hypothetical protein